MKEKPSNPALRRILLFLIIVIGCMVIVVGGYGLAQIVNWRPAAPPPPPATLLPTFSSEQPPTVLATEILPTEPAEFDPPSPAPVNASQLPNADAYHWIIVADGFEQPLDLQHAGDDSGRLFVVEQPGQIWIMQDGQVWPTPFLDIRDRVGSEGSEQGLLGLAFAPDYDESGFFFVNYTDKSGDTVIARFRVSADPDLADSATEQRLLQVSQPYANHNGGGLAFGPDGFLYAGLGDGGLYGDPLGAGQDLDNMLGKLLRFDVQTGVVEVYAHGLRNPWRFSFDSLTDNLHIGDVGQNNWEEINYLPAGTPPGANFGWDYREGFHAYEGEPPADFSALDPVAEYDHQLGCSVTGGVVYRGSAMPAWQGVYLYGDYCTGRVWGLLPDGAGGWHNAQLFGLDANIASFGQDQDGRVYIVDLGGAVYLLVESE